MTDDGRRTEGRVNRSRRPDYNPYNVAVGGRIKARRRELRRREGGWTQTDVAERLGVGREAYNHYESGRSPVPTQDIARLAALLGVSVNYILGTEDDLSGEEREIVRFYGRLPEREQALAFGMLRELYDRFGKGE